MCDKAVNIYLSAIKYVPDHCKTEEMWDEAVDKCPFVFDSVPGQYKFQEICDKFNSEDPLKLKYFYDRCKTQEMCNKPVDNFLPALNFLLVKWL